MHPSSLPRIPALDGLRGLAVAGVLAFHAGLGWARGGFLGVSLFFTLSGFLICSLLLAEREQHGRVDLRRFWARRARRLLPASLLALLVVLLFGATAAGEGQLRDLQGDVLAALAYVANWRFVLDGATYADLWAGPSPVQHFWSLAIEEQFYVAFPLLVVAARRRALLGGVLVAGIALSLLSLTWIDGDLRAYYGTDARAAELLIGALLAVVLARRPAAAGGRLTTIGGATALALLLWSWSAVGTDDGRLYAGGLALHAVLVAAVIVAARAPGPVASALSLPPLRWLGRISYGAYLYHWPLFLWLTPARTGLDGSTLLALRLAATLVAAEVSYRLLEEPIRAGRRLTPQAARVALSGAAAAVVAGALLVQAPSDEIVVALGAGGPTLVEPPTTTLVTAARATPTTVPPPGPGTGPVPWTEGEPLRVYVAGDSNAYALGVGLSKWSTGKGIQIWTSGWMACHLVRGGEYRFAAEPPKATDPQCDGWVQSRAEELGRIRPHVTIAHIGAFDLLDRRLPGSSTWRHVGQRGYDSLLRREIERFTDLVLEHGSRMIWSTYPGIEAGRVDGARPTTTFPENDPLRVNRLNWLIRQVAATRPGVEILDLRAQYQAWPGGELALEHRPDGLHPTQPKLKELVRWVGPQLVDRARRP